MKLLLHTNSNKILLKTLDFHEAYVFEFNINWLNSKKKKELKAAYVL